MAPRANFMCETCHEDYELPISAKKCPICSADIIRLFDAVNVSTGLARGQAADRMTQPYADEKVKVENRREDAEKRDRELADRVEHAMPQVNQQILSRGMQPISAGQAIGMVSPQGRQASQMVSSLLFGRRVSHVKIRE